MTKLRCDACNEEMSSHFNRSDGKPVYKFLKEHPYCGDIDCLEELADEYYPEMREEYQQFLKDEDLTEDECYFFEWIEESQYIILRVPGYFEDEYVEAF